MIEIKHGGDMGKVKVNTQIDESQDKAIMRIVEKKDWSKMKVLKKILDLAFENGLHKQIK